MSETALKSGDVEVNKKIRKNLLLLSNQLLNTWWI